MMLSEMNKDLSGLPLNGAPAKQKPVAEWYAVYTNPRAEKLVYSRLVETGIETYLPLQKTYRQWSDRKKLVEKPLLSSYLFVKVVPVDFPKVYRTPGVVKFVSFEGSPVPIPQYQIDTLRLLIDSNAEIEVTSDIFEMGDHVKVTTGSLAGLTGELVKRGGRKKVVIRIDSLEQNIILSIPLTFLQKIKKP